MIKFLKLTILAMLVHSGFAVAQVYNKTQQFLNANKMWAMPRLTGLDFRNGKPVPFTSAMPEGGGFAEGAASACDPATGDLLFYTNGSVCWNADHKPMPNGSNLLGNASITAMQGACIVPVVGDPDKYYLFSLNGEASRAPSGALFYNVVDMTLDNGKGDIVAGQKNVLLDSTSLAEAMIAVPGEDCDVWLIVHAHGGDKTVATGKDYRAYHITRAGINPVPIVSQGKINLLHGTMAVSSDRSKIALTGSVSKYYIYDYGGTEVVKFDPTTGMVSDAIVLPVGLLAPGVTTAFGIGAESVAFSPDNTKLYCDEAKLTKELHQFTVNNHDSLAIAQSKTLLPPVGNPGYAKLKLRMYNDSIYVLRVQQDTVGIIKQPNLAGTACQYVQSHVILRPAFSNASFPNELVYAPSGDTSYAKQVDTVICSASINLTFFGRPDVDSYEWNTGDTDTSLTVSQYGTYWVMSKNFCQSFIDTFVVTGAHLPTPVISVNGYELSTGVYDSYQWYKDSVLQPGATNQTFMATENAIYSVHVSNAYGCIDSTSYEVTNVHVPDLARIANVIQLYPNPAKSYITISSPIALTVTVSSVEGKQLIEVGNAHAIDLSGLADGMYIVQMKDASGMILKTERLMKAK